jgi:hypothetical protein
MRCIGEVRHLNTNGADSSTGARSCAGTRVAWPRHPVRYVLRPPLARERLQRLPEHRVRLELKRPWSDGTTARATAARAPPYQRSVTRLHPSRQAELSFDS